MNADKDHKKQRLSATPLSNRVRRFVIALLTEGNLENVQLSFRGSAATEKHLLLRQVQVSRFPIGDFSLRSK